MIWIECCTWTSGVRNYNRPEQKCNSFLLFRNAWERCCPKTTDAGTGLLPQRGADERLHTPQGATATVGHALPRQWRERDSTVRQPCHVLIRPQRTHAGLRGPASPAVLSIRAAATRGPMPGAHGTCRRPTRTRRAAATASRSRWRRASGGSPPASAAAHRSGRQARRHRSAPVPAAGAAN